MNYTRSKRQKNGFTLIATILVVSLLTVLVVAATVVSQIEQQAQYNASRQEVARQNALFGLNQALNQLQTAAGPDRRVTARADILNANQTPAPTTEGYSSNVPSNDSGQAFWTGVWKNTNNDYSGCAGNGLTTKTPDPAQGQNPGPGGTYLYYDYTPDGSPNTNGSGTALDGSSITSRTQLYNLKNVNWLISWPYSSSFTAPPDPTKSLASQLPTLSLPTRSGTTLTLSGSSLLVPLANGLNTSTVQAATASSLSAPKVPIFASNPATAKQVVVGTFAYWISDEGVKAKANITDPFLGQASPIVNQAHFIAAQSNASSTSLSLNNTSFPSEAGAADLRTTSFIAPTLAAMGFADAAQTWGDFDQHPNTYSPDFTVYSYGVIADNYNGGLRQDLTAALENPAIFQRQFSDGSGYEAPRKMYSVDGFIQSSNVSDIKSGAWSNSSTGTILDGMRWSSLYYYYNIYHTTMSSPLASQVATCPEPGIGSKFSTECGGATPNLVARIYEEPNLNTGEGGVVDIDGIMPILGYWNFTWGIDLNCTVVGSGAPAYTTPYQYNFVTGVSPTMILMNPFDISLTNPAGSYYQMKGNIGSFNGSSAPPALQILNGANKTIWGSNNAITPAATNDPTGTLGLIPLTITFPDPTIQTDVDSVPYNAGEVRTFGLPNSAAAQAAGNGSLPAEALSSFPVVPGSVGPPATPGSQPFPTKCALFTTASSNKLVSTSFSVQNAQEEMVTLTTPISIANPSGCSFVATGSHRIGSQSLLFSRFKYPLWPYQTAAGTTSAGSNNIPSFTWSGGGNTVLDSSLPTSLNTNNPDTALAFVMSFEDHMPGTAVTSFTDHNANLLTHTIGMPIFSAGGPYFNPYNTEFNTYSRDFQNTGRLNTSMYNSSSDLQVFSNTVNGSPVTGSYWLPNSAGKNSSSQQRVITFDLPRQPIISLGQFRNMFCRYASTGGGAYSLLGFSVHPLGGSYLEGIPTTEAYLNCTGVNSGGYGMPNSCLFLDDNFLANSTLFDGYFMSTVPPNGVADAANWPISIGTGFVQSSIDSGLPLPNSRLIYYDRPQGTYLLNPPRNGNPPSSLTTSPNISDLQCPNAPTSNIRKPAANLLINGAFNINSTSVAAWTALLTSTGSSKSNVLSLFDPTATSTTTIVNNRTFTGTEVPFLNFSMAAGPALWSGTFDSNQAYYGLVDMSTSKVMSLATNIVAQVKTRGPFLSLGDFLNHRLTATENPLSTSGALQSAIDALGYNSTIASSASTGMSASTATDATYQNNIQYSISAATTPPYPIGYPPLVDNPAPTGMGVPGTLTQGDLVQVLAPVISSRSDTFTIRTYGQAVGPNGASEAEAYCEAVIQRLPEYEYSTENGITDTAGKANYAYDNPSQSTLNSESISGLSVSVQGLTPENSALGRRFKIISIRWLNKNEI